MENTYLMVVFQTLRVRVKHPGYGGVSVKFGTPWKRGLVRHWVMEKGLGWVTENLEHHGKGDWLGIG